MSSINLSQSNLKRSNQELNTIFDKSLVISSGLIVLSFGAYFGLTMYNSLLEKKTTAVNDAIAAQLSEFEGDSVNRVVDFQERMKSIDAKLMTKDISPQDMFASIEKLMVSGASLDSYKYDVAGKTVSMKVVSSDFKTVARQIMSFKSLDSFKSVTVGDVSKGSDGNGVTFDAIISL